MGELILFYVAFCTSMAILRQQGIGTMPYSYRNTSRVIYSAYQVNIPSKHKTFGNIYTMLDVGATVYKCYVNILCLLCCTIDSTTHAFVEFGALYMHNPNDKHVTRQGCEPGTCEFRATAGSNELSGLNVCCRV